MAIVSSDSNLKILQILRAPVGGLWRHVADLTGTLAERGHQVGLVIDSTISDVQTDQRLKKLEKHLALGLHRFDIPRLAGPSDATTPFKIRKLVHDLDVDILHGHGAKGGMHARLARLGLSDVAAIYTPHGGVLHFDAKSLQGRLFHWVERRLLGATDTIIFESRFAHDAYVRQIAQPACPAPVIHNGLAEAEFLPVPVADDAADFVFIGELRGLKGIDLLITALKEVHTLKGRPATLVIAGDGAMRNELDGIVSKLGLQERVTFLGVQPARTALTRGRCLVVPSLAESLPYVVLEAAAAGRPVIATAVGGIGEIFGPTQSALIESGNVDILQAALRDFLADEKAAEAQVAERMSHIRSHFSLDHMTDQIESVYRAALAHR